MPFRVRKGNPSTADSNAFALSFGLRRHDSDAGFVGRLDLKSVRSAGRLLGQDVAQTYVLLARVKEVCRPEGVRRQALREKPLPLRLLHRN